MNEFRALSGVNAIVKVSYRTSMAGASAARLHSPAPGPQSLRSSKTRRAIVRAELAVGHPE
jgi:hypothetical protein